MTLFDTWGCSTLYVIIFSTFQHFLMALFSDVCVFCFVFHQWKRFIIEARIPPMGSQKLLKSGGQMKRNSAALSASTPPNGLILFACSTAAHAAYYFWIKCGIHSSAIHSFDTPLWNLSCLMRLKESNIGIRRRKSENMQQGHLLEDLDRTDLLTVMGLYISNCSVLLMTHRK